MEILSKSLSQTRSEFPLQLSRFVKDIQRKKTPFLNLQNTIADAITWMGRLSVRSVPVMVGVPDRRTLTSVQFIESKALIQMLLSGLPDHAFRQEDFFTVPLSEFPRQPVPIVCPDMPLTQVVRRMYNEQKDFLLVSEGIRLVGLVTVGDILDVMIGAAVLDNALFDTDSSNKELISENARICCLKQKISTVFDSTAIHQLNTENTILTAARILLNPSVPCILLTNRTQNRHQLVTAENLLLALLSRFKQTESQDSLNSSLMCPLDDLFEIKPPEFTADCTVFEAAQAIHFSNLTCAAVLSDRQQIEGIVTTNSLLKAFLDSMDRVSMMT